MSNAAVPRRVKSRQNTGVVEILELIMTEHALITAAVILTHAVISQQTHRRTF